MFKEADIMTQVFLVKSKVEMTVPYCLPRCCIMYGSKVL